MQLGLLAVLACPKCGGELICNPHIAGEDGDVIEGTLQCGGCGASFGVTNGIPRFVGAGNYADSFGYQWNLFRAEQIDSINGTDLSAKRFFKETGWKPDWMKGKWILDAGCGAGRFLDVAAGTGAEIVGLDVSEAIDAAAKTVAGSRNVHLVQASIYELPFKDRVFDGVYCIGVIQHTPDPARAVRALPKPLKAGGSIALTIYERKPWTRFNAKYLVRPITSRIPKTALLGAIRALMPALFPLIDVLFRLPLVGRIFTFLIPVANYAGEPALSRERRYRWTVMDTFDMLSPVFDYPQTEQEVMTALSSRKIGDITRLPNRGLNIVGIRLP